MSRLIPLVLLAGTSWLALPTPAAAQVSTASPPVVVTRGEATLTRAPDQAWVSIAAESREATPAEAQGRAADAMAAAQTALAAAGVSADAIRTTGYSLRPDLQYQAGQSIVRGYIAHNRIEVRVDDLDRLGAVLDAAGSSGATSISGLRFDITDRAEVERQALTLAVEDAMARARAIGAGANAELGAIVRIDEEGGPRPVARTMLMRAETTQAQTPINPGEIEIVARVMLTVRIHQGPTDQGPGRK